MIVWVTPLLGRSRMFYTENQRKCFFEKADELYEEYCVRFAKEIVTPEKSDELEKMIRKSAIIDDWWEEEYFPGWDKNAFLSKKVFKALFDDLDTHKFYWEEVCSRAPRENPETWYQNSTVKSLLHEFINDEEDPYKIIVELSEREIACLTYTLYSIFVNFLQKYLEINSEDADKILAIMYCGEFAQNEWLNLIYHENIKDIQRHVTERFLYAFLMDDYSRGMEPDAFYEFLHEEIMGAFYREIYDVRAEILKAGREYLSKNDTNPWSPKEMNSFYKYITDNVNLEFEAPHFEWYLNSNMDLSNMPILTFDGDMGDEFLNEEEFDDFPDGDEEDY